MRMIRWLKNLLRARNCSGGIREKKALTPVIVPRAQHRVSRTHISKYALKVLYRLQEAGFEAYLVGGGVRDVLLDLHPKDFDIATNALPEEVQDLFYNCRLIGRRFRLAHVHFGSHIVEVATFRANALQTVGEPPHSAHSKEGMILRDNTYGSIEEDVLRRDFTVNALYYNISDFSLVDYVNGLQDLAAKRIRMIGDAQQRYREDPVRMLRAVRFAAKLNFKIHPETAAPMRALADLVQQVPAARLLDEYGKLFLSGHAQASFDLLRQYGLFALLFPETEACIHQDKTGFVLAFLTRALQDTDARVREEKSAALPFLLAVFLWDPVEQHAKRLMQEGLAELLSYYDAYDDILAKQHKSLSIPKRLAQTIREIWTLYVRLMRRTGKSAARFYAHPRFRSAYDFLCLRANAGDPRAHSVAEWWQAYVKADDSTRLSMVHDSLKSTPRAASTRRKRKKRV